MRLLEKAERAFSDSFKLSPEQRESAFYRRSLFFLVISIVGSVFVVFFGLLNLWLGNGLSAVVELSLVSIVVVNVFVFYYVRDPVASSSVVLLMLVPLLWYLFSEGGIEGTGIVWFFTFPPMAIFMLGRKRGAVWICIFLGGALVLFFFSMFGYVPVAYPFVFLRQTIASIFLISVFLYVFDYITENAERVIVRKTNELRATNARLNNLVESIQEKNESLEDTRKAMLNIMDDLETEKELVEVKIQEKTRELAERVAELAETSAKSEAILSSIADGVLVVDPQGKALFVNSQAEQLLGWKRRDLMGKTYSEAIQFFDAQGTPVPDEQRPLLRALREKRRISSDELKSQFFLKRNGGGFFPVSFSVAPVMLGRKIIAGVGVFRDISHEMEVDKAKTEFVSLASHQLRTPLTAIKGYVSLLQESAKLSAEEKDFLSEIEHANLRMIALINSLLDVSRIDLGVFSVNPVEMKLVDVAEIVRTELLGEAERRGVNVVLDAESNMPLISADPNLVKIMLQNLASNAVKYTPSGGSVVITLRRKESGFMIEVSDTGHGIPEESKARIFTKLYRADNAISIDPEGTGLGLYLVKSIVENVGGEISFESAIGKGTTFRIFLPESGMLARAGSKILST